MTKISKISVTNLKSIQHQEIEMNGASIIVTAGNGKGKSTLTRSFFDRIREILVLCLNVINIIAYLYNN